MTPACSFALNTREIASRNSLANYSFYMGASNDNIDEVLKTDTSKVCGIKVFMGSSTGNMLVDNEKTLESIFSKTDMLIATHCEDEATIRQNAEIYKAIYGDDAPTAVHPEIRSEEACYRSSSMAVERSSSVFGRTASDPNSRPRARISKR